MESILLATRAAHIAPGQCLCACTKLVFALSHGVEHNLMTYQAYDINGYTFYIEEKDMKSNYQNSGVRWKPTLITLRKDTTEGSRRSGSSTTLERRCRCSTSDGPRAS